MTGLKKLLEKTAGRLAVALAVCAAAVALTMCDAPTMWQGVSSTASGAGALSGIRFTESPEPQNYTEGRTPAPVMKAQISAPPAVTRLAVKWYREKDVLRLQWNKDTATEVAAQSLFADGYTDSGDNTFDTAYTLTGDDLTASGTYYYYAVVEDAIYSAPAMAQINTLGPAVSAVSGGASYLLSTTFVQALSATVTLPADNTDNTLDYQWQGGKDGGVINGAAGKVNITAFTRLEDGRYSYLFEYTPDITKLTVGETYEYTLQVENSHGTATSPQGARVTILASTEGGGGATAPVDGDTDGDGYPDEWETAHPTVCPKGVNVADTPYGIDLSRKGAVPPGVTWFADTRIYTVQKRTGVASYRVYQSTASAETDARIVVARGAKAAITLDGVTLTPTSGSPIDIAPTASLTLLLKGTNRLAAQKAAGIHVPQGATLIIDSAAEGGPLNGVLYAEGGRDISADCNDDNDPWGPAWPGIGGDVSETTPAGTVIIRGGVVIAQGGGGYYVGAAGIGGACDRSNIKDDGSLDTSYRFRSRDGGTVSVSGGLVIAKGGFLTNLEFVNFQGEYAFGIGGGRAVDPAQSGTLSISGGTVLMNLQHEGHMDDKGGPVINGQFVYPSEDFYTKAPWDSGTAVVNGSGGAWSVVLLDDDDLVVNGAARRITIKTTDSDRLDGAQRAALEAGGWSVVTQ